MPTNTDNLEWWSGYPVPDLPVLDFAVLRASAVATNTINCNGNWNATANQVICNATLSSCVNCVMNLVKSPSTPDHNYDNRYNKNYVWYWDNNVNVLNPGVKGTFIVRGNLSTTGNDWYGPYGIYNNHVNVPVPTNAWLEYQKMDNSSANQYPADNGLQKVTANYIIGAAGDAIECACPGGCSCSGEDLGFYGFIYVGGNVNFQGDADVFGAIWVVGSWTANGNNLVFYDDNLLLPMLNVVLVRQSWKEVGPSATAWP